MHIFLFLIQIFSLFVTVVSFLGAAVWYLEKTKKEYEKFQNSKLKSTLSVDKDSDGTIVYSRNYESFLKNNYEIQNRWLMFWMSILTILLAGLTVVPSILRSFYCKGGDAN